MCDFISLTSLPLIKQSSTVLVPLIGTSPMVLGLHFILLANVLISGLENDIIMALLCLAKSSKGAKTTRKFQEAKFELEQRVCFT